MRSKQQFKQPSRIHHTIRGAGAAGLTLAAAGGLAQQAAAAWPGAGTRADVEDVVGGVLAWSAAGLAAWLAASCVLALLATVPGAVGDTFAALTRALAPHVLRRALSLGLGATVGAVALPAPAAAASADVPGGAADAGPSRHPMAGLPDLGSPAAAPSPAYLPTTTDPAAASTTTSTPVAPDIPLPGWLPDRPPRRATPEETELLRPALRPGATAVDTVTVRRGDTLWSIAARYLGPRASESEIAAEWPRWYAANRAAIGSDPDVIRPGQQLVAPAVEVAR